MTGRPRGPILRRGGRTLPQSTITTFGDFAELLLAGRRLATCCAPAAAAGALAVLAHDARLRRAVLRDGGLGPVAEAMAARAEAARHFTHDGRAKDDAIAVFWQVAPSALADPAVLADPRLVPAVVTDRMVAAIRASPHARDFGAAPLAERFFREAATAALSAMAAHADRIDSAGPADWRAVLRRRGVAIGPEA